MKNLIDWALAMKQVNKYTRAKKGLGKVIACPFCNLWVTVYHFAWSAITCQSCGLMVKKEKWLIVDDKDETN